MASPYKRNGWYWLSYNEGGVRKRVPLQTKDKAIANFKKNEIELKLAKGESPLPDKNITLKAAFDEFIKYAQISNRPRTVEYYQQTLNPFINTLPTGLRLHQLKEHTLTKYIDERSTLKESGRWHLIKVVNTLLNFCIKKKYITTNPVFIKKPRLPKRTPECWTPKEVKDILEKTTGRARQAIFINLYLGLRPAELTRLQWQDIDFKGKTVTVREGKTGQFRKVPLHDVLAEYLKPLAQKEGPVIPDFTENYMRDASERIKEQTNMKHIKRFWYATRHTFATEYYKQTGDVVGLKDILGHSNIQMTMVYVNPQQDHQHKQLNKLVYT